MANGKRDYIELRTLKVKAEKRYSSTKGIHDVHIGTMKGEFKDSTTGHVVKATLNFEATNLDLLSTVMPIDVLTARHLKLIIPDTKLDAFAAQPDKKPEPQASITQFLPPDEGNKPEGAKPGDAKPGATEPKGHKTAKPKATKKSKSAEAASAG